MADKNTSTDEDSTEEPWVTVQLAPAPPGARFAAFLEGDPPAVIVRPVGFFALQHLAYEETDPRTRQVIEEIESRVVPLVFLQDGTAIYLGPDASDSHAFAGLGDTEDEARRVGATVLEALTATTEPAGEPELPTEEP